MAIWRPLCCRKLLRASMRSKALAAPSRARGGVRKSCSAHAPANSENRTFVLIQGSERVRATRLPFGLGVGGTSAPGGRRGMPGDQFVKCRKRSLTSFLITEQTSVIMASEHDAEHLEADLPGIGVPAEMAFLDRQAHRLLGNRVAAVLIGDRRIADRSGPVVILDGR